MAKEMHEVQSHPDAHRSARPVLADGTPWRGAREILVADDPDCAKFPDRLSKLAGLEEFGVACDPRVELPCKRDFLWPPTALTGHAGIETRCAEPHHAIDEIADHVGQILVDGGGEMFPG